MTENASLFELGEGCGDKISRGDSMNVMITGASGGLGGACRRVRPQGLQHLLTDTTQTGFWLKEGLSGAWRVRGRKAVI